MPNHASEFLRGQLRMKMADQFEQALATAMNNVANAAAVTALQTPDQNTNLHKLPPLRWTPIYTRCQRVDMQAVWGVVGAARINNDGWYLYWADNGTTKELLLIGRWVGQPPQFQDYFEWTISNIDQVALSGNWNPPQGRDNTVNMAFQGNLIYSHADKHFGAQTDEAQFTIGANQAARKRIVAGMEQKAIAEGLDVGGEVFFRFNVVVGTDGQTPQQQSASIRVDTPGGPSQHSHPIPENQAGMVSHDGKVKSAIRMFTTDRDLGKLVDLAKYLRIIGAANGQYTNLRADAHLYGHLRPPPCVYWAW
jgi:hypothetical protein